MISAINTYTKKFSGIFAFADKVPTLKFFLKFFTALFCISILLWAAHLDSKWALLINRILGGLIVGVAIPIGANLYREILQPSLKKYLSQLMGYKENAPEEQRNSCKTNAFSPPRKVRKNNQLYFSPRERQKLCQEIYKKLHKKLHKK